jgi:hypothetical protein
MSQTVRIVEWNNGSDNKAMMFYDGYKFNKHASKRLKLMEIDQASKSIDHAKFRQRTSTTASTTEIICSKQEKQDSQLRSNQFTPINHLDVITVSDNTYCDTEKFDYRLTATSWLTDSHIDLAIQSLTKFGNPEFQIQTCLRTMELSRWKVTLFFLNQFSKLSISVLIDTICLNL